MFIFHRKLYFKESAWFLLMMLIYIINSNYIMPLRVGYQVDVKNRTYDQISLGLDFMILLLIVRYAYREISQMIAFGFIQYFLSLWNYIDILLIIFINVILVLDVCSCIRYYTDFEIMKVIHAFVIFALFMRLISIARGVKGTSFMIR